MLSGVARPIVGVHIATALLAVGVGLCVVAIAYVSIDRATAISGLIFGILSVLLGWIGRQSREIRQPDEETSMSPRTAQEDP